MKKIILELLLLLLILSGCSKSQKGLEFQEGSHVRDSYYDASFKTQFISSDNLALHIQDIIYEKEQGLNLYDVINNDIIKINEIFQPFSGKVDVYVVKQTIDGCRATDDGKVFCTVEEIKSGEYRLQLVQAMLGLNEPYQYYGIVSYLFSEKIDSNSLKEYYETAENLDLLTMFAAYFNQNYVSEDIYSLAIATAASMTEYIIEEFGVDQLLQGINNEQRQKYLDSIGVKRAYESEFKDFFELECRYDRTKDYSLVIRMDNLIFYLNPEGDRFTPQSIMSMLQNLSCEIKMVMLSLEKNTPQHFKQIKERFSEPISIYFKPGGKNTADHFKREINFSWISSLLHEIMHVLILHDNINMYAWVNEGMAELLSTTGSWGIESTYYLFSEGIYEEHPDTARFCELAREYYLNKTIQPNSAEEFNQSLFYDCMAIVQFEYPELKPRYDKLSKSVADVIVGIVNKDGNLFSYEQARYAVQFLINEFGWDKVIGFCINSLDFEESFGYTYAEFYDLLRKQIQLD